MHKIRLQWNANARWWQLCLPPWGVPHNDYINASNYCRALNELNREG
jgi:hypothetical protein